VLCHVNQRCADCGRQRLRLHAIYEDVCTLPMFLYQEYIFTTCFQTHHGPLMVKKEVV
jgi:hypothetical protein